MNTRLVGYLYLALAMIGVGSTVAASRLAGEGLPPFTATALRFAIAWPVFCVLMRIQRVAWPRPARRDALLLVLQASAGAVGYTVLLIAGTQLSSPVEAGVMLGTLPAMSTLIAALLLGERQTRRDGCAAALATAGVLAVTMHGGASQWSMRALTGDLLVLAAVACESVFVLLNRRLAVPLAPLALSMTMSGLGLALSLVPAAFELLAARPAVSAGALGAVVYYALVPTVLGYLLWYAGSARTSGTEAALFTALAPVSAVLLSSLMFADALTAPRLLGIALVLAGVMAGAWPRRRPRAATLAGPTALDKR
ncbi:DMT family transporter [Burkholderia alba]|uniref:DMT family transporter n=1 Tax=Burkholderia alba TaxID=2683677 RepID=UPI002B05CB2D|nr:DMT family transporter [Burkholderia alba]